MRAQPPRVSSDVAVVHITTADYEGMFGARSPLDPDTVARLIAAAQAGRPAAIGVDLDVEPVRVAGAAPVVWGSGAIRSDCGAEPCAVADALRGARDALGSRWPRGLAVLLADPDWVIRRYAPMLGTPPDTVPVFSTAVLRAAGRPVGAARRGVLARGSVDLTRERLIEFRDARHARIRLAADELMQLAGTPGFTAAGPLRGKIVLIGGSYEQGRDRYVTPLGLMPGVDIWAQVIETELEGGGSVPPGWIWPVLLQLGSATLIILVFRTASLRSAMLFGAVALPTLSVFGALLAFGSIWHALYFFPSLIVILIWELYDRASDYLKLLKQRYTTAN